MRLSWKNAILIFKIDSSTWAHNGSIWVCLGSHRPVFAFRWSFSYFSFVFDRIICRSSIDVHSLQYVFDPLFHVLFVFYSLQVFNAIVAPFLKKFTQLRYIRRRAHHVPDQFNALGVLTNGGQYIPFSLSFEGTELWSKSDTPTNWNFTILKKLSSNKIVLWDFSVLEC